MLINKAHQFITSKSYMYLVNANFSTYSDIPPSIPSNAIISYLSYPVSPSDNVTVNISVPVSGIQL